MAKNRNKILHDIYRRELAELYIDVGRYEKALEILESVIRSSSNANTVHLCVGQLCRIILLNKDNITTTSANAFQIIKRQRGKYDRFSPNVKEMIEEAFSIMKDSNVALTNRRKTEQKTGFRKIIKQLFGFKKKSSD